MDGAVNLLPRLIVSFYVVFFATVLLDLRNDFCFAVSPADAAAQPLNRGLISFPEG